MLFRNGDTMTDEPGAIAPTVTPAVSGDAGQPAPQAILTPEPTGEKPDAVPEPAKEPVKKKPDPQKSELSYLKREIKRRDERLLSLLEKQLDKPAVVQKTDDPPPDINKFSNLDEYLNARDAWIEKKRAGKEVKPDEGPKPNIEYERAVQAARDDLMAAGSEKYEDFEELVTADNVKITPAMRDALFELDDSDLQVEVTYFLAQNPKETLRISKLSPLRQIAEIGKLEAKISSAPPPKKPSNAPDPIAPVGSGKVDTLEHREGDSYKEFERKERARLKAAKRKF